MESIMDSVAMLREMSERELTQVAEDGLRSRVLEQAEEARRRHGIPGPGNLSSLLEDRSAVRYAVRLVLDYGPMAMNQFAQPEIDRDVPKGKILFLRPSLGKRPDQMMLAICYMIPVINYGGMVSDEHCVAYGARLLGLSEEEYYRKICELADEVGVEVIPALEEHSHEPSAREHHCKQTCKCGGVCSKK